MKSPNDPWEEHEIDNYATTAREALDAAIARFNQSADAKTLLWPRQEHPQTNADFYAASERALTYRIAFYLECALREMGLVTDYGPVFVDVEYNRHIGDEKTLAGDDQERIQAIVKQARQKDLQPDDDGFCVFSIAPDIIVHVRGQDINLMVIEIKKHSNKETGKYDRLKLELFTRTRTHERGFGYRHGVWIMAEDDCSPPDRKLHVAWECHHHE